MPVSNNRNGTSSEVGLKSGVALNIDGMEQAGMGLGIGDHNLHGNVEIFKTHSADDTSILYRNDGEGFFDDVTDSCGFGTETRYIGWGAGIIDLDTTAPRPVRGDGRPISRDSAEVAELSAAHAVHFVPQPGGGAV